jgi:hypothetical protein
LSFIDFASRFYLSDGWFSRLRFSQPSAEKAEFIYNIALPGAAGNAARAKRDASVRASPAISAESGGAGEPLN